jgi:hypothetical protein
MVYVIVVDEPDDANGLRLLSATVYTSALDAHVDCFAENAWCEEAVYRVQPMRLVRHG